MSVKSLFTTAVNRVKFHAPEILIGAGIVGLVGGAVLAVRRGVRWHRAASNMIKSEHEAIKKATEVASEEDYPKEERAKDYG